MKITKSQLKEIIKEEVSRLQKKTVLENRKKAIIKEMRMLNEMTEEEFEVHGHYTVSNAGGFEIMLSPDGDSAKVRDAYGSDNPETSDWLEIEYVDVEDGELDEEGYPESEPVIDPNGYNIPLSMVMKNNFNEGFLR